MVVVVDLVAEVTRVVVAAVVLVSVELLISEAVALARRTQILEEWGTAEVESASACIILRVESRVLRLDPRVSVRLSRRDHLRCRVRADVRLVA